MKIATYKDGSRDGQLVVVSRDLKMAHYATGVASRLQQVLDDWNFLSPQLEEISQTLNHGRARHAFAFDPRLCMAPLPRAFYLAACDADPSSTDQPLAMHIQRSDKLLGACDPVKAAPQGVPPKNDDDETGAAADLICAGQLAVITGDLAAAATADNSLAAVRLVMASARWLPATSRSGGWTTDIDASFSPVAVTPDELGAAWRDGLLDLDLQIFVNGKRMPTPNKKRFSTHHMGSCLAGCVALRGLCAGSIVSVGSLAEPAEVAAHPPNEAPAPRPAVGELKIGDSLRVAVEGRDGEDLFGAISVRLQPFAEGRR